MSAEFYAPPPRELMWSHFLAAPVEKEPENDNSPTQEVGLVRHSDVYSLDIFLIYFFMYLIVPVKKDQHFYRDWIGDVFS